VVLAGSPTSISEPDQGFRGCTALLTPELPYSILPDSVREGGGFQVQGADAFWEGRPVPPWRGIPCRPGFLQLRLNDELVADNPIDFRVLVLVPDRNPSGPRPEHILLGAEFFTHYGLRVTFDYSAIRYLEEVSTRQRRIDSSISCGYLEKD
jgi:hypothetical protein